MLQVYVFLGGLALVMIGVVVTLIRRNRRVREREAAMAKSGAAVTPRDTPAADPAAAVFDPNATRILVREVPAGKSSELRQRDEAVLPAAAATRLVCVGGTRKGTSFPITAAGVTVGRGPLNDIVISDPRVSHHHAWVGIVDHKAVLRDLGSTNGTFLNAQMDARVREVVLNPGDTIFFGGHGGEQFRFLAN